MANAEVRSETSASNPWVGSAWGRLPAEAAWWTCSFVFHALLMCTLMLYSHGIGGKVDPQAVALEAPAAPQSNPTEREPIAKLYVGGTPIDPPPLADDPLSLREPPKIDFGPRDGATSSVEEGGGRALLAHEAHPGALGNFDMQAHGPGTKIRGPGSFGPSSGGSPRPGAAHGFTHRDQHRGMVGGYGGTKASERAVAAALNWLARHQNVDGSWSLARYPNRCKGGPCSGTGLEKADTAATALALLPFLAAGQTHESKGPYRKEVYRGLYWLLQSQKKDGDLRGGLSMYAHGLASICLCEAYGLSGDQGIRLAAERALAYIAKAQDDQGGGWRYEPGQPGDTSVVGWQVMAAKSAQMAELHVPPQIFPGAKQFLASVACGPYHGQFSYTPLPKDKPAGGGPATTAVGLLCSQYLGAKRNDPLMTEGVNYLMRNAPDASRPNIYYWYYATQVMHNVPGLQWDAWNRQMRRVLIESQCKDGCAAGSWDPMANDPWAKTAGRIYTTALAALTLEVYYRYLPLYKLDAEIHGSDNDLGAAGSPDAGGVQGTSRPAGQAAPAAAWSAFLKDDASASQPRAATARPQSPAPQAGENRKP